MGSQQMCSLVFQMLLFFLQMRVCVHFTKENAFLKYSHNIHDLVFVVEASAMKNTSVLRCDLFLYFSRPFMLCKHLSPLLL